jgi:hypothetical protein
MVISAESFTCLELSSRCQLLLSGDTETSLIECDRLICDIDQATDWGFITDRQAIEMLQIVYRCRRNLLRGEMMAPAPTRSSEHNSIHEL